MKLKQHGKNISAEVSHISIHGIWVLVGEKEYCLPFTDYPWFKSAIVSDIHEVKVVHETHLYWPALDIDLELDSLEHPERYPLRAR
ncbi:MAG: DUF2442 domain-containing protein [Verrucomicrobiota bacterium]|nr:DUF2442 domain-containing protein [Verrucomicrobiota bacterium]